MQIIETETGRVLEADGQTYPLPSLAVDAMVYVYNTPDGIWYATQERGKPRPMYAGAGGELIGQLELTADLAAVLEQEKQRAKDILKAQRDAAVNEPLNGFEVSSPSSREDIQGAINYFNTLAPSGTITWTMADSAEREVTLADLQAARDGYVLRKGQVFAEYQQRKAELMAAQSQEEIDQIISM